MDPEKTLLKIVNRYEQVYRKASLIALQAQNPAAQVGALNVMLKATEKLESTTTKATESGTVVIPLAVEMWRAKDADPTE